jgi:hypothetical protein
VYAESFTGNLETGAKMSERIAVRLFIKAVCMESIAVWLESIAVLYRDIAVRFEGTAVYSELFAMISK